MSLGAMIFGGILTLAAAFFGYKGFQKQQEGKTISTMSFRPVGSASSGLVKVSGQVGSNETIKSPFSKTDCVVCEYSVKEYQQDRSNNSTSTSATWNTIRAGTLKKRFGLTDNSGSIWVDPDAAELYLETRKKYYQKSSFVGNIMNLFNNLKNWEAGQQREFDMTKQGIDELDPHSWNIRMHTIGDRVFEEKFIQPDDRIYVVGQVTNGELSKGNLFVISDDQDVGKAVAKAGIGTYAIAAILLALGIILFVFV